MHNSNLQNYRIANKPINSMDTWEAVGGINFIKRTAFLLSNDYLFSICKPENLYFKLS